MGGMTKIYATLGLPGSGKTTLARERCSDGSGRRANRDDIRFELFGKYHGKGVDERKVSVRQDELVGEILAEGKNAWIDDTNLSPRARQHCEALAKEHGVELEWVDLTDVPITVCVKRDLMRDRSVGEDVIYTMWERYLKPPKPVNTDNLPECVVIDLDGTLALMQNRSPYEWKKVGQDAPNRMVVDYARRSLLPVIVLSGRDGSCRPETGDWLARYDIPYHELLMREADDMRADYIVKGELLDDLSKRWFPVLAIDDRQQVVSNVWRARGIDCWQVAAGRF